MRVYGFEITESQIEEVKDTVLNLYSTFRLHNVRTILESTCCRGMPLAVTDRAADRLLQKWRKQGLIRFVFDYWVVVK